MIGGKDRYVCLLSLIKREAEPLYNVICELCMDGTFRTQRYMNTFLMPSKDLIKKLEKMVADDKDEEAIDSIRSLLLKGHYSIDDFKKKDVAIGTLQSESKILADPALVGKHIAQSKKSVIKSKNGTTTFLVYDYSGDFPQTVEGKSGKMILATPNKEGGANSSELKQVREITEKLIVANNAKKTVDNFFKAVAGILVQLQDEEDSDSFEKAKFYLAANPILSWFFLTMPGSEHGIIKEAHLKDFDHEKVLDLSIISECAKNDYEFDQNLFKKINRHRTQLISEKGDKSSLMGSIKKAYAKILPEMVNHKSINSELSKNIGLKILMDELRFMYEGCVEYWDDVDDTISALGEINWSEPEKFHVLTNDDVYKKHMLKGTESFISGPVTFVKSVYFAYVPLTATIEEQLELNSKKMSGGSIHGGNPTMTNTIIFSGGAARKMQSKVSDLKLASLVKVLSKQQRSALRGML